MRIKDSWKLLPLEAIQFFKPRIVIDLRFCDQLRNKEQRSVITQLGFTYGFLRQTRMPLELHLTSLEGEFATLLSQLQGFSHWKVFKHTEPCDKIFEKTTLIYLSPDSTTDLLDLDEEKTYVIGGIVDHNRLPGLTEEFAKENEILTVRLPIQSTLGIKPGKSLNINHVFEILCEYAEKKDWAEAISSALPTRKSFQ